MRCFGSKGHLQIGTCDHSAMFWHPAQAIRIRSVGSLWHLADRIQTWKSPVPLHNKLSAFETKISIETLEATKSISRYFLQPLFGCNHSRISFSFFFWTHLKIAYMNMHKQTEQKANNLKFHKGLCPEPEPTPPITGRVHASAVFISVI